jgi:cell division protein FtsQ
VDSSRPSKAQGKVKGASGGTARDAGPSGVGKLTPSAPAPPTGRRLSPQQVERERRRAEKRRAIRVRAGAAVAAIVVLWAGWTGIANSRIFEVKDIEVTGVSRLTDDEVIAQAEVPVDATLLALGAPGIEDRLLEHPWIASVSLSRRVPSTLRIEVVERLPAAIVDTGQTFWFVDRHARVLSESVPDSATVLPVIRDVADFTAEPGVVSDSGALQNALKVLDGLGEGLLASVRTVSAPTVQETALLTAGSVEIMIGEAVQMDEKSVLVSNILREQGSRVVFIDVRSVERPISRGLDP